MDMDVAGIAIGIFGIVMGAVMSVVVLLWDLEIRHAVSKIPFRKHALEGRWKSHYIIPKELMGESYAYTGDWEEDGYHYHEVFILRVWFSRVFVSMDWENEMNLRRAPIAKDRTSWRIAGRLLPNEPVLVGEWQHPRKAHSSNGACQFRILANHDRMEGEWIGRNISGKIISGPWVMEKERCVTNKNYTSTRRSL